MVGRKRGEKFNFASMHSVFYIPFNSRLQDYVTFIWEVAGEKNSTEIILPKGIIEIVFNFAEQINGVLPGGDKISGAPRCFIQGVHTNILRSDYIGRHRLLGVRLHPYSVEPILGVLPSELNNSIIDLTLINPAFNQLWHQLAELNSFNEKVKLLEKELPFLPGAVCSRAQNLSHLFLSDQREAFKTVDELALQVCYSPRQLNRVAHSLYGLSAEELTIYKKFVESIKLIHNSNMSLTAVAYNAGFYDQAHFCRVFKSYTGMTPNYYKKHKSTLPFHIIS